MSEILFYELFNSISSRINPIFKEIREFKETTIKVKKYDKQTYNSLSLYFPPSKKKYETFKRIFTAPKKKQIDNEWLSSVSDTINP